MGELRADDGFPGACELGASMKGSPWESCGSILLAYGATFVVPQ